MAPPASKTPTSPSDPPEPPGSPDGSSDGALSEGFRHDLASARRALDHLVERLRRWRRGEIPRTTEATVPSGELVARLQQGILKEHDLVLAPLLGRLEAIGTRLARNEPVPAVPIEEGLALVDRYLTELHDAILRLLEIADVDSHAEAAALLALQQLGSEHEHARVRWATVRVMLRGYEEGIRGYGVLLGLTLTQESHAERAWDEFEHRYIQTHLPAQFPHSVADTWQTGLDHLRTAGRADRIRVEEYLQRTVQFDLESR